MFFEPGIQVNPVINTAPPQTHMGYSQLRQERDTDAEIHGCLLFRQAAHRGQRQAFVFHHIPLLLAPRGSAVSVLLLVVVVLMQVLL